MRDYERFDKYLNVLMTDIYEQPPDDGHIEWAINAVDKLATIPQNLKTVLDIGCGQGFMKEYFEEVLDVVWSGITIGEDFAIAKKAGIKQIYNIDMTFLPWAGPTFDLIFARHVLEHSPFPLISLMEWRRVCKDGFLLLIVPAPGYWGYSGRNHYHVMNKPQIERLLKRAGWEAIHELTLDTRHKLFLDQAKGDWEEWAKDPKVPAKDVEYQMLCQMVEPEEE